MPDSFDLHELKPEKLHWKKVGLVEIAETSVGTYTIQQKHYLKFKPRMATMPEEYLGKFKDAKKRAREHFRNEA